MKNNFYNKPLHPYARENRKQMRYTFHRQRPVLNYIADFMCKELNIIIEVDGYTHLLEDAYKLLI